MQSLILILMVQLPGIPDRLNMSNLVDEDLLIIGSWLSNAKVMSNVHRNFTEASQKLHRNFIETSQNFIETSQKLHRNFTETS